jgi:hypothetical protein
VSKITMRRDVDGFASVILVVLLKARVVKVIRIERRTADPWSARATPIVPSTGASGVHAPRHMPSP